MVSFSLSIAFSYGSLIAVGHLVAHVGEALFALVNHLTQHLFLTSTASFFFLSSAANFSASLTARSMSSLDILVEEVMVICCSLPVPLSVADTFTIPFASISNVTSICGTPRGAGVIPSRMKLSECGVSGCHIAFALEHVNFNGGLTVSRSGVNLALLYRNCGVSVDDTVEYAAESFNTE